MACRILWKACVVSLALALAACEDDVESMLDGGERDAGERDAGERDAGEQDAGGQTPDDAAADAPPASRTVELSFEARVGGAPFDCTRTYEGIGTSAASIEMLDFRFYVYDVRLIDEDGAEVALALTQDGEYQYENVALLDFEDRSGSCSNGTTGTHTVLTGTLPEGNFKGLRFGVGVPKELNHTDRAKVPSPLNLTAMTWTWQAGRLFTRIDARVATSSGPPIGYQIHLGSAGCSGNPAAQETVTCQRPNRAEIALDDFDLAQDKVVIDYTKLVAGLALDQDQGGAPGCMADADDPECLSIVAQLGLEPETGTPGATAQKVFSVEPK